MEITGYHLLQTYIDQAVRDIFEYEPDEPPKRPSARRTATATIRRQTSRALHAIASVIEPGQSIAGTAHGHHAG
jgi:hypothetical protein